MLAQIAAILVNANSTGKRVNVKDFLIRRGELEGENKGTYLGL